MSRVNLMNQLLNKPIVAERGQIGFNMNVDVVLEELVKKAVNTDEEKELANLLHRASLINRNPDSFDEKIQKTLDLINASNKGIKTQYSCSSHPRYYFNLPMSWIKEEENKAFNVLNVEKDSETGEYMLGYPSEFYIRCLVPNELLPDIQKRVISEMRTTKPAEELFGKPYTVFHDEHFERAEMNGGNSLFRFLYVDESKLNYIDGLNVRVSPYDANTSIVSVASDLINPLLFALEDADYVYWELIGRLEIKTLRILGVIK